MNPKVLIVEDEKDISDSLAMYLKHHHYSIYQAYNGNEAIEAFKTFNPDIILLDNLLPDISGDQLCKLFKETSSVGIIYLTAYSSKENILKGFNYGADDYIGKPFDMEILRSRIIALYNRIQVPTGTPAPQVINSLLFDYDENDVCYKGNYAQLTLTEFKILKYLSQQTTYCTDEMILELLYGPNCDISTRTISVHIANIRKKLKSINRSDVEISKKYNKGYILICN